ncbi:MAG: hypothetical protein FGF48_10445 [Candidatus Brockarchaeota archaeon]|nr:hypothetical protein [Candidatus Brockarchaeota archaeon]
MAKLGIAIIERGTPWQAMEALDKIIHMYVPIEREKVPIVAKIMLNKGLGYVPAIVYTVWGEPTSPRWFPRICDERMKATYSELRQRVEVRVRRDSWLKGVRCWTRAEWPIAVLGLKEVRDEVRLLLDGVLLSEGSPEDRELVRGMMKSHEGLTDERVIEEIKNYNAKFKEIGVFLEKVAEVYDEYPAAKFWIARVGILEGIEEWPRL